MASFRNDTTFRYFNFILTIGGVPLYDVPKSFVYRIFVVIFVFCCTCTISALVIHVYVNFDDLGKAADSIICLPPFALSIWIQIFLSFRKKNILKLLHFADSFIWEDLPPMDVATGNMSMGVLIRRINTATKGSTIVFPGFIIVLYTCVILTSEERVLTADAWYPYDWTKSPAYEITLIVQVVNTLGLALILYAFPPLYATLVVIACSQLEKIRNTLSNIKQQRILSETLTAVDKTLLFETPEKMFAHMQEELNECIRLHQKTIRFMKELEDNFSALFVGIFLILMIALCFASFAAVLEWDNPFNLTQSGGAYVLYMVIIIMFCWFPSELNDQAQRVRDAAFGCDWVGAPISFQKSLSLMIACTNKEIILTAGKCVPVSKETMVNMIQESMSLFMFLLQVREEDEDQDYAAVNDILETE